MNTSILAMGIAFGAVVGLVVSLVVLNFVIGALETYLGGPKFTFLQSRNRDTSFAFAFDFNDAKEPASFNRFKLRLFNPRGKPTQIEIAREFEAKNESFALELDMGEKFVSFLGAQNFDQALVQIELTSDRDGITHQFEMKGKKFKSKLLNATKTIADFDRVERSLGKPPIDVPIRSFIADTVPGKGAQLAIATNPEFAHLFAGAGEASSGAAAGEAAVNFSVSKVWIEPGCIVCNACEDIYPEVFEVTSDSCIIRPNAPLDDGLRVQDAAEACPVEVIKFTKIA